MITDSTTYLPESMIDGLGIERVSLYVGWSGEMKREDEYDDLEAFYRRLRESPTLPTTSQPSIGDFEAKFEPALRAGNDIASVHIAGGISGTCDTAREAARSLAGKGIEGRIEVIDGQTGAGGLGCLVLAAASAARLGSTIDEVVEEVHRTRRQLEMWFCLDTLEYLRRGGRIGAAQALVGTALRIKPILTFGTEITPVDKVRTKSRALAADGLLPRGTARARRQRLDGPACPVRRGRRTAGRAGHRGLRLRAALLHSGRAGARHPPGVGDARRRHHRRA